MNFITTSLFGAFLVLAPLHSFGDKRVPKGVLRGIVLTREGKTVPNAEVTVSLMEQLEADHTPEDLERFTRTNRDGTFTFSLPRGSYAIKIERDGFCTPQRALVAVGLGTTTKLTVYVQPAKPGVNPCAESPTFDEYSFLHSSGLPMELRISYDHKEAGDGHVIYEHAVVTWDTDAVFADRLIVNTRAERGRMDATGHVLIDLAGERRERATATIRLPKAGSNHLWVEP